MTSVKTIAAKLDRLIEALEYLGYVFDVKNRPQAVDWALEIRLKRAIEYAQSKSRKKAAGGLAVFDDPALGWVREEKIVLPARFYPHPQALAVRMVDSDAAQELKRLEQRVGVPVPASLRTWFETCGSVDLRGRHPFLNPQGELEALHIAPLRECVDGFDGGRLPLGIWKVLLTDATLEDGRPFPDAVNDALHWAGIPGLAASHAKAERELEYIRSRMEAR